jgi:hypothetical protein
MSRALAESLRNNTEAAKMETGREIWSLPARYSFSVTVGPRALGKRVRGHDLEARGTIEYSARPLDSERIAFA